MYAYLPLVWICKSCLPRWLQIYLKHVFVCLCFYTSGSLTDSTSVLSRNYVPVH
ncbi:unnamed protein product [Acanthoscelides obtectus]|uniref:Uncharacterized protein n=1 Tax=Acanthoscelides obtectus TaxID=200917 RepID=A0A9P0P2H0_ACAOB|nr:unnamed protein product [Acanthoscelides obtectus]CAK1669711.1 hypothetical protein AOBTE_LOCUS27195 [Acanthoscelides obtectus]